MSYGNRTLPGSRESGDEAIAGCHVVSMFCPFQQRSTVTAKASPGVTRRKVRPKTTLQVEHANRQSYCKLPVSVGFSV